MKRILSVAMLVMAVLTGCKENPASPNDPANQGEPSLHPSEFTVLSVSDSSVTLSWVKAQGSVKPDNYLILMAEDPARPSAPTDGTAPAAGPAAKIVSHNANNTVTFTGLKENQRYNFAIYPYTGSGSSVNYKNDTSARRISAITTSRQDPNDILGYFPLTVGTSWVYDEIGAEPFTSIVQGELSLDNMTYRAVYSSDDSTTILMRRSGDTIYANPGFGEETIFMIEGPVGTEWVTSYGSTLHFQMKIMEKGLTRTVHGKTYSEVMHIRINSTIQGIAFEQDAYFAKGIGRIEMSYQGEPSELLISHDIK